MVEQVGLDDKKEDKVVDDVKKVAMEGVWQGATMMMTMPIIVLPYSTNCISVLNPSYICNLILICMYFCAILLFLTRFWKSFGIFTPSVTEISSSILDLNFLLKRNIVWNCPYQGRCANRGNATEEEVSLFVPWVHGKRGVPHSQIVAVSKMDTFGKSACLWATRNGTSVPKSKFLDHFYSSNIPQIWPLGLLFHEFVTFGSDFG